MDRLSVRSVRDPETRRCGHNRRRKDLEVIHENEVVHFDDDRVAGPANGNTWDWKRPEEPRGSARYSSLVVVVAVHVIQTRRVCKEVDSDEGKRAVEHRTADGAIFAVHECGIDLEEKRRSVACAAAVDYGAADIAVEIGDRYRVKPRARHIWQLYA